jgi:hypothetical protein
VNPRSRIPHETKAEITLKPQRPLQIPQRFMFQGSLPGTILATSLPIVCGSCWPAEPSSV